MPAKNIKADSFPLTSTMATGKQEEPQPGEMMVLVLTPLTHIHMHNKVFKGQSQNIGAILLQKGHSKKENYLKKMRTHLKRMGVNTEIYMHCQMTDTLLSELKNKNLQILLGLTSIFKLKSHLNESMMTRVQVSPDFLELGD